MFSLDDTIAAIASAPGGAARGIVRVSGPAVTEIVARCFQPDDRSIEVRTLVEATAIGGRSAFPIPHSPFPIGLFLWPTSRSYTRQPLAEFHTIGSPPLLNWLLECVCAAGARLAQPGEFTLRAFLAGRIDLTQAEAVLGVVDAADRRQLNTALAQLAGGLSHPLRALRDDLLDLLADLEAGLDFAEEDIRFVSSDELDRRLSAAGTQLKQLASRLATRGETSEAPRVTLAGAPNVGKSSLFNALVRRSAALVSPQPGTTRDYLVARIDVGGLAIELVDTAGRDPDPQQNSIGEAAQSAAAAQHDRAELRLLCLDITRPLNDWEQSQMGCKSTIVTLTKCDLPAKGPTLTRPAIATSSRTGAGLEELRTAIGRALVLGAAPSGVVAGTAVRINNSVRLTEAALVRSRQLAADAAGEELVVAELRVALIGVGKDRRGRLYRRHIGSHFQPILHRQVVCPAV